MVTRMRGDAGGRGQVRWLVWLCWLWLLGAGGAFALRIARP